jgi:uncharacterized protein (TIGR00369 family)
MRGGDVVYLPTYPWCFVCGQDHPKGLRIRFYADEDKQVHARFRPDTTQTGYDDIVHGGVISALLDELIGWSVSLAHDTMAFTAELTVRFLKPVHAGREYVGSSRIGVGRRRYWEAEGVLVDEHGQPCARGRGKYFLLADEQTARVAAKMTYQPGDLPAFHRHMAAIAETEPR